MQYVLYVGITNIKCAGCVSTIDQAVLRNGANRFDFDFQTNTAKVYFEGEKEIGDEMIKAIIDAGYRTQNPFIKEV